MNLVSKMVPASLIAEVLLSLFRYPAFCSGFSRDPPPPAYAMPPKVSCVVSRRNGHFELAN